VGNTSCTNSTVTLYSSVWNISQLVVTYSWPPSMVRTAWEVHGWDFATVLSFWHATARVGVAGDLFLPPPPLCLRSLRDLWGRFWTDRPTYYAGRQWNEQKKIWNVTGDNKNRRIRCNRLETLAVRHVAMAAQKLALVAMKQMTTETVSMDENCQTFRRHYSPSKRLELFTQQHSVTSRKTCIFNICQNIKSLMSCFWQMSPRFLVSRTTSGRTLKTDRRHFVIIVISYPKRQYQRRGPPGLLFSEHRG
jgi:hypothetical protein